VGTKADEGAAMTMRALVSADRPVVRIWHPDDPKLYVEIQFETQKAANTAVEQLNSMLRNVTGLKFGQDA
jgi:hypothetical protein